MAWLSAQSGPPAALARVETSHEVEFLVKSEEEKLAELMFEERARREAEEKKANLAAQIAAAKATMGARVAALLNEKLAKSWQKISSLFRSWDVNGDGWITKREFAKGMGVLGLGVSPDDVDELFAWFDPDNSGTIEFGELNTLLRRGQTIEVDGLALQSAPRVRQPGGRRHCRTLRRSATHAAAAAAVAAEPATEPAAVESRTVHHLLQIAVLRRQLRRRDRVGEGARERRLGRGVDVRRAPVQDAEQGGAAAEDVERGAVLQAF